MKIVLPHKITTVSHFGYKGFLGTNPNVRIVDNLDDAEYIWYHTVGDSAFVQKDLDRLAQFRKPTIAVITGDQPVTLSSNGYLFGTTCGFNVPYEYSDFICCYLNGSWNAKKRENRITFRGDKTTWRNRPLLQAEGIKTTWVDWWKTPKEKRASLKKTYTLELNSSVFSLCPRGNGPSSMRLFESMLLGAIPVRLDDMTKPFGEDLSFSPRFDLDKTKVSEIVNILNKMSDSEISSRRKEMKRFVEDYLVIDSRRGCQETMGYSEWIRDFIKT